MNRDDMIMRGPVWRLWLGMSLPTIFVMLVIVAYNMADVYFIGRVGDAAQVAAISLAGPAYGLIQGLGTLLGSGGCTAAALASGRGRRVGPRSGDQLLPVRLTCSGDGAGNCRGGVCD